MKIPNSASITDRSDEKSICEKRLAQRWDVSPRTLQRWRKDGCGPPYMIIGGTVRYRMNDIIRYEDRQTRGGAHD